MQIFWKRLTGMVLVLVMIAGLIPAGAVPVRAEDSAVSSSTDSSALPEDSSEDLEEKSGENPEETPAGNTQEDPEETPGSGNQDNQADAPDDNNQEDSEEVPGGDGQEVPEQSPGEDPEQTPEDNTSEQEEEDPETEDPSEKDESQIPAEASAEEPNWEPLTISILGDSISTYAGVSNDASANATIGGNAVYYSAGTSGIYRADTWWQQAADVLGLQVLVNNSWSGSCVLTSRAGTEGAYADRCIQLHTDDGRVPQVIAVFLGTNDFSYFQNTLGTAEINYDTLITELDDGSVSYGDPGTACEAYAIMLDKITRQYPDSTVICILPAARRDPDYTGDDFADVGQPTAFNASLKTIAQRYHCAVVDLENCGITKDAATFDTYMADKRVHPNAAGMDLISQAFVSVFLDKASTLYDVHFQLSGLSASGAHAALGGSSYTATVTPEAGYSTGNVTVTMNGKDITESCYANGMVSIANVTGDITITAEALPDREALDFRWEYDGTKLISVATDGNTQNTLTRLAGTVTNGVFEGGRYALEQDVLLLHNQPWVLEWKASGDWSAMLLTSHTQSNTEGMNFLFRTYNASGLLAIGEFRGGSYHNYGVALSGLNLDMTQAHIYRLENRIAEDGSNMVWLSIDGTQIGAMNNYYIGGTSDQKKTVNWVSGRDFTFGYIGSTTHPLKTMALEYLQVWEGGRKDSEGTNPWEGKVISVLGDSISTFAGYIPVADGFNREHLARYPQDNLLTDVNETWWMQVVHQLDAKLGINDSWRGAMVSGAKPVTTGDTGENASMANLTRIRNLGSNGTPDVILFYGGTNDLAHLDKIGSFDPQTAPSSVELTTKKWDNLADAYVQTLLRLRHYYPDAQILAMLPTVCKSYYSNEKLAQANGVLAEICEHYGVPYIDLRDCGITVDHLPDGIHPGAEGMDLITEAVIQAMNSQCQVTPGEHTVCSVTHNLTGVTADKGYIRGLDAGKGFTEKLTGENMEVTVTMGGKDITGEVYADGTVTIGTVTGDLVITAKADFSLGSRLQALPEAYENVNLWPLLKHDPDYYTETGWAEHASGKVVSVTIPVQPGEKLYASSFGAGTQNGSGGTNGCRVTFFSDEGVLVSRSAGTVYTEFTENGFVTVPQEACAANIPMWTNDSGWVLKFMGDNSGEQEPESNPLLTGHLQQLPEPYYDVDLWQVLEHDAMYYGASGWTSLNSKSVQSVTIPVTPGQHIYASSFGASSGNGSTTAGNPTDGIRVSWFTETGLLKTVSPANVYQEFSRSGYLTVPQGAVAVCIPVWNADDAQIMILAPGPEAPAGVACLVSGGTETVYDTLSEALAAAASGGRVKLLQNAQASVLTIFNGTVLDLNGFTLTADYVSCFGSLEDSSEGMTGLLCADRNNIMLRSTNASLPVRTQGGYGFGSTNGFNKAFLAKDSTYAFQILVPEDVRSALLTGGSSTGVSVHVSVSWETGQGTRTQDFVYKDSMVMDYLNSYKPETGKYSSMFTLRLNGAENLNNLKFTAVVKSDLGVTISADPVSAG